ncbi:hypothetical protein QYM36_013308 [Artemia franciscana]|uniref:Uncharacterized protein n=1 Tax=Artemia franciscana TaxID=6661 RepID=A0AA88HIG2_ARTSF|nr:hypothetical protein QYM36_013308 [Artemia franciscana]
MTMDLKKTKVMCTTRDPNPSSILVIDNLDELVSGYSAIGLQVNGQKTEFLVFSSSKQEAPAPTVSVDGAIIAPSSSLKYLGLRSGCTHAVWLLPPSSISLLFVCVSVGSHGFSRKYPLACWVSTMLVIYAGGFIAALLLGEPMLSPLKNTQSVHLATAVWYVIFYSPFDIGYKFAKFLPVKILIAALKEVYRTKKVYDGVSHAAKLFPNSWLIMIVIGVVKGNGGGFIKIAERLIRGVWTPRLKRTSFDNKAVTFEYHIRCEHNMWHYLFFLILIKIKDPTEFTAPESFVADMFQKNYDWSPRNRTTSGLSLAERILDPETSDSYRCLSNLTLLAEYPARHPNKHSILIEAILQFEITY